MDTPHSTEMDKKSVETLILMAKELRDTANKLNQKETRSFACFCDRKLNPKKYGAQKLLSKSVYYLKYWHKSIVGLDTKIDGLYTSANFEVF